MSFLGKYSNIFEYLFIPSYLFIIYKYITIWLYPELNDGEDILSYATLMAFEFVLVHSGIFMAAFNGKRAIIFFFIFYGLFAFAINASMPNNTVLYVYMFVILNRMRFAFFTSSKEILNKTILNSIVVAVLYIILLFSILAAHQLIPEFGLHAEFLKKSDYNNVKGDMGGLFMDLPHVPIFFGIVYYICLIIVQVLFTIKNSKTKPRNYEIKN